MEQFIDIYNSFNNEELQILYIMKIEIKKEKYSKKEYDNLCANVASLYKDIKDLKNTAVSLEEYAFIIEKIYELEKLFK